VRDGGTDAGRSVVVVAQGSGGADDPGGVLAGADGAAAGADMAAGAAAVVPNGESDPVVENGERRGGPSGRGATEAGGVAAGGAVGAAWLRGAASGGNDGPAAAAGAPAEGAP